MPLMSAYSAALHSAAGTGTPAGRNADHSSATVVHSNEAAAFGTANAVGNEIAPADAAIAAWVFLGKWALGYAVVAGVLHVAPAQ